MRHFLNYVGLILLCSLRIVAAQETYETKAVVGDSAELPCNVTAETEGDKLNVLAWYMNGSSTAFYSRDLRGEGGEVASSNSRYQLVSLADEGMVKLVLLTVRPSDATLYLCLADFAASPAHKTYVKLIVIEPPQRLWVIHENGSRVATAGYGSNNTRDIGPYYLGDTVHLFCVAFGGKPQPIISWWTEDNQLKDTSTPLSEQRVRSDLTFGPLTRDDHERVLMCTANNNENTPPINIEVTINMYLPPELVTVRSEGREGSARVRVGQLLPLQCRVLGASPPSPVIWQLGNEPLMLDQQVTMEPSQRLVVSSVRLQADVRHDEAAVSCCTAAHSRHAATVCAPPLPIVVVYAPIVKIMVDGDIENNTLSIVKGSELSMNCSIHANPEVYDLLWFFQEDVLRPEKGAEGESKEIQKSLSISAVSERDAGEYVCAATNDEGATYSEPLRLDVTYPAYCETEAVSEYGLSENESINITCNVKSNPEPRAYRWVLVNDAVNVSVLRGDHSHSHTVLETQHNNMCFRRPNDTTFSTIFCWGVNDVTSKSLAQSPCTFLITDETPPRPPIGCVARKTAAKDITVTCQPGHNGGLSQKFKLIVKTLETDEEVMSIVNLDPHFIIQEPTQHDYKFVIVAENEKGESEVIDITKECIIDELAGKEIPLSAVTNITTLALSLCGGVALLALAACGLVLCANAPVRPRDNNPPPSNRDPPLCAYNTEESNCETCNDSDEGSECNLRRNDSFRRAVSRYPPKTYDVRRSNSFHSSRYLADVVAEPDAKCGDNIKHSTNCRVHSLQNINRKRDMDTLCDHLVMRLPPEPNYNVPRPMNTFYTMPRRMRQKPHKDISDEISEIAHSDGCSLPPPPDEFTSYRPGSRIKDMPPNPNATYSSIIRKPKDSNKLYTNVLTPMNTIGLPTISGGQTSMYSSYPGSHHGRKVNANPFDDDT